MYQCAKPLQPRVRSCVRSESLFYLAELLRSSELFPRTADSSKTFNTEMFQFCDF